MKGKCNATRFIAESGLFSGLTETGKHDAAKQQDEAKTRESEELRVARRLVPRLISPRRARDASGGRLADRNWVGEKYGRF